MRAPCGRRAAADQGDEGMYFNSPPASRNNAQPAPMAPAPAGPTAPAPAPSASVQRPPQSGGITGKIALQEEEEEEDDDDYDGDDLMDQVAAYQQQLRTQGKAAAAAVEQDDDDDDFGEIIQQDVSEYQLQLRNRDEADAVTGQPLLKSPLHGDLKLQIYSGTDFPEFVSGLATGNLKEIVSTRPAPKSAERSPAAVVPLSGVRSKTVSPQFGAVPPDSNRSALGEGIDFRLIIQCPSIFTM